MRYHMLKRVFVTFEDSKEGVRLKIRELQRFFQIFKLVCWQNFFLYLIRIFNEGNYRSHTLMGNLCANLFKLLRILIRLFRDAKRYRKSYLYLTCWHPWGCLRHGKMTHHTTLKAKFTAPRRKQPCSKFLYPSNYLRMLKCL